MTKKHRIMFITHDMAIGGLQQVIVNICRKLDKKRFEPSVLCLRKGGEFENEIESLGINLIKLPRRDHRTDYFTFLKVAKILKNEKIDIIHTHNTQPLVDGTLGAMLSGVRTIVHTDHARAFPDKKRYMLAEWCMSHFVHKIVGVSDHTSKNLVKFEHISPKKIVTILNGIDGERYNITLDKQKKRKALGINHTGPIIGLGVRLAEQKGIKYLLRAIPAVVKEFPDLSVVIAGKGELESVLLEESRRLNLNNRNVFFIGPRLDMPEIINLLDIYVLPSIWEGLPMVLLEALAAGCPIIATDVGGNKMAVKPKYNGILVPPKSSERLSSEIIGLLKNHRLMKAYRFHSKQLFEKKFSAATMTQKYEKLYMREHLK